MTAMFNEPIQVTNDAGEQFLWLGVATTDAGEFLVLVDAEGFVVWEPKPRVRTKWRWDADLEDWIDASDVVAQETTVG